MKPELKAVYMVGRFVSISYYPLQCALVAVEEILNEFPQGYKGNFEEKRKQYWKQVKQEIEKL